MDKPMTDITIPEGAGIRFVHQQPPFDVEVLGWWPNGEFHVGQWVERRVWLRAMDRKFWAPPQRWWPLDGDDGIPTLAAEVPRLREVVNRYAWRPIETAPHGEECFFWLDWADDVAELNPPIEDTIYGGNQRLFRGKRRCWSSVMKATHWMPLPASPTPPEAKDDE